MTNLETCLCGSQLKLAECCLPYIQGKKTPPTAESLMRARYTAFARGDVDFILDTHHSKTKHDAKREEIEEWSKGSEWLGLEVLETLGGQEKDNQGIVVFNAKYKVNGRLNDHHERSYFEREDGKWKFLDGEQAKVGTYRRASPKVGRNDPCPCGSGKKFKKCCADATQSA